MVLIFIDEKTGPQNRYKVLEAARVIEDWARLWTQISPEPGLFPLCHSSFLSCDDDVSPIGCRHFPLKSQHLPEHCDMRTCGDLQPSMGYHTIVPIQVELSGNLPWFPAVRVSGYSWCVDLACWTSPCGPAGAAAVFDLVLKLQSPPGWEAALQLSGNPPRLPVVLSSAGEGGCSLHWFLPS